LRSVVSFIGVEAIVDPEAVSDGAEVMIEGISKVATRRLRPSVVAWQ
jgi:hypothetical protein